MEKIESIIEGQKIESKEKAEEMAYAEKDFQELAKAAYELKLKEKGDEYLEKGEQAAEEAGKKWDEELKKELEEKEEWEKICQQKVEKIGRQILNGLENSNKTGQSQEINLDEIIGPDILFGSRGSTIERRDEKSQKKLEEKRKSFFSIMTDFLKMEVMKIEVEKKINPELNYEKLNPERKVDIPTDLTTHFTKIPRAIIEQRWYGQGRTWKDEAWAKERVLDEKDIKNFQKAGYGVTLKVLNLNEWQKIKDEIKKEKE